MELMKIKSEVYNNIYAFDKLLSKATNTVFKVHILMHSLRIRPITLVLHGLLFHLQELL